MGIGLGLAALKVAYRATGKSFRPPLVPSGMRNSYDGAGFDSMRPRLTTYLKYRNNISGLQKKNDWFCA